MLGGVHLMTHSDDLAACFRKRLLADVSRNSLQPDCYYARRKQPKPASKFRPGSDVNPTVGNGRSTDPAARQYPSQYPARFGIKGIQSAIKARGVGVNHAIGDSHP